MSSPGTTPTPPDLRLIVITDVALAAPRSVRDVVAAALDAGAPAIQLRDKNAAASTLLEEARELLTLVRRYGALLFINDRIDVALAAGADGVHLGPDDLPVQAARRIAPRLLIGFSTDDPDTARRAQQDGADYIGCGAVFGTRTKDVGEEAIGVDRLEAVAAAVSIPVVGIGGVTTENAGQIATSRAAGAAVVGAVMAAPDPAEAVRTLLHPFRRAG